MSRLRSRIPGPWVLISTVLAALIISPFAVAATTGSPIMGGKRSPSADATKSYTSETEIIANTKTYGTRQSNKSDNGGGAIYGCRSKAGGIEKGNEPCVRASNLVDGRAFEFNQNGKGTEVGRITSGNPAAAPFTTNATGVATGLNADRVDGKNAEDLAADAKAAATQVSKDALDGRLLFASVAANGTLGGARGVDAARVADAASATYEVVFKSDVSGCALTATQQTIDNAGAVGVELQGDKKTVRVRTRAGGGPDGTDAVAPAQRPFHVVATC